MPIIRDEKTNDVYLEYNIPEDIKKLITKEFLIEFRKQLFIINKYSLRDFVDEGVCINTSTSGWYTSFYNACVNTNLNKLVEYQKTLDWYDSDIFDSEITNMLADNNLILNMSILDIISEKLNIDKKDLKYCSECGGVFTSYMGKDSENEYDEEYFICNHCIDELNTAPDKHVTQYYLDTLKRIEESK